MFLNDWDRHDDQWRWGRFKGKDGTVYRPFPRDRDFAFLKADGFFPWLVDRKWGNRRVSNFDYKTEDPVGLASGGNPLDRHWITELEWDDWMGIVDSMKAGLTDKAIEDAFLRWPKELRDLHADELIGKRPGIGDDLLPIGFKPGLQSFSKSDGLGSYNML